MDTLSAQRSKSDIRQGETVFSQSHSACLDIWVKSVARGNPTEILKILKMTGFI